MSPLAPWSPVQAIFRTWQLRTCCAKPSTIRARKNDPNHIGEKHWLVAFAPGVAGFFKSDCFICITGASSLLTAPSMRSFLFPLLCLTPFAQALYFFIDASTTKCFYEELPQGTLVVGHYWAEEFNEQAANWQQHDGINIFISVDVCLPSSLRSILQALTFKL